MRCAENNFHSPNFKTYAINNLSLNDSALKREVRMNRYLKVRDVRRGSAAPRYLRDLEEDFLTVVEAGDVDKVKQFVKLYGHESLLDFNCTTYKGLNAIKIAVQNDNEEMVHFLTTLLDEGEECSLMYAIQANKRSLVEKICKSVERKRGSLTEKRPCLFTDDFPPDMTPIMLAATLGHFEIIGFLIKRGHSIVAPHPPDCFCADECIPELETSDLLDLAERKMRKYSAISNPAYFVYVTDDPVRMAFKLYASLNRIANFEMPFRTTYVELADKVSDFAAALIGQCRNSTEVRTVLKQYSGLGSYWVSISQTEVPRLIMAMDYKQKKFVAQPNVQVVLEEKWLGDFVAWKNFPLIAKLIWPFGRMLFLPYAYFVLLLAPKSAAARYYSSPVNKMISFIASYLIFLGILSYYSLRGHSPEREVESFSKSQPLDSKLDEKWQNPTEFPELECAIMLYVVGLTAATVYQCLSVHPKRFFNNGWNQYDVAMLALFWLTFAFWFANLVHYYRTPQSRGVERKYWAPWDPELLAEGFFVVGNIMAFCKFLQIFQTNYDLGPMQVALDAMVNDCAKYSLFAVIILLAYTCGMSQFYSYYNGMRMKDPKTGDISEQQTAFISFWDTFKNFFWAIFGLNDESISDVVIENVNPAGDSNDHIFTEGIGYFVLGSFMVLMALIIVNMLVATMSETYANVISDVHTQWLFGRTEVYLYFLTYPVLPPPLNLLPQTYSLTQNARSVAEEDDGEVEKVVQPEKDELDYAQLSTILVTRYFSSLKIREND